MRPILKQGLYLMLALAGIYAILLSLSYLLEARVTVLGGLDSSLAERTIFTTEPKYVFLNRAAIRPNARRIVFVGASNTVVGFKQREVQPLLADAEVDNLSVGGSNLTQIAQIVALVQDLQDAAARRRTTFVIGIWYGMFAQDGIHWDTADRNKGDTDIDIERYRYGFYRRSDHGPVQVLPSAHLPLGVMLIHPYLVFDELSRRASKGLRARLGNRPVVRTDAQRDATVVSAADQEAAMKYWLDQMHSDGPIAEEQFLVLKNLILRTLAQGSRVLLVDLPIPSWHAQRSPFYPNYLKQRTMLLTALNGQEGLDYLNMDDLNSDGDFSDEVHPKPRVTKQWAARVAAQLGAIAPVAGAP